MIGRRIALVVDHPQRDLAGIVLVAAELCRRGATCFLVPHNGQDREIWALAPDFVLLNFARRGCDELAASMTQAGIRFGVLDTEGAIWDSPDGYSELLWSDPALRNAVQPMCTWGRRMAAHLADGGFFAARQLHVTGCPRFDFYHPSLRSVIGNGPAGPAARILINTNFYTANSRFVDADRNVAQLRDVFGWSHARATGLVERERQAIAGTIAMARGLARHFPEAVVVLRPHPFERTETYSEALADLRNVTINGDGPVQGQISSAAVVIQRSCTTALEATFAGIPTLSPRWITAGVEIPMAEAVSVPCATLSDMSEAVAAILGGRFRLSAGMTDAIANVTADWFHAIDGRSYLRVADALAEAATGWTGDVDRAVCSRNLYGLESRATTWLERAGRQVRWRFGLGPDWSFRKVRRVPATFWDTTNKAFGCADVSAILHRLRATPAEHPPPLSVALARDLGECADGYHGRALRLSHAASSKGSHADRAAARRPAIA